MVFNRLLGWRSSRGLHQSLVTIIGNSFSTLFSAVALILISRWLGPTDFGEFSVGFALVQILARVNDFGMSTVLATYIPRYKEASEQNNLINFSLLVKIVIYVIIVGIGLLSSGLLVETLNFSQPLIIFAAFLTVIATVLYEHLLYSLQSLLRFAQAIGINTIQAVFKIIGVLVLMILQIKNATVFFSFYMLAPLVPVFFYQALMPKTYSLRITKNVNSYKNTLLRLAPHAAVSYIIAGIVENIDILFVRNYLNAYETGLLSGVSRISMFILLIAYSLGNVLYPRVARYQNATDMKKYIKKATLLSVLSLVGVVCFFPLSRLLIVLTIGPEYELGVPILNILAISSFLTLASIPFIALFYAFDNPWLFSVSAIGQLLIILIGNIFFVPEQGLMAAAYAKLWSRVFLFVFALGSGLFLYWRKHVQTRSI